MRDFVVSYRAQRLSSAAFDGGAFLRQQKSDAVKRQLERLVGHQFSVAH